MPIVRRLNLYCTLRLVMIVVIWELCIFSGGAHLKKFERDADLKEVLFPLLPSNPCLSSFSHILPSLVSILPYSLTSLSRFSFPFLSFEFDFDLCLCLYLPPSFSFLLSLLLSCYPIPGLLCVLFFIHVLPLSLMYNVSHLSINFVLSCLISLIPSICPSLSPCLVSCFHSFFFLIYYCATCDIFFCFCPCSFCLLLYY